MKKLCHIFEGIGPYSAIGRVAMQDVRIAMETGYSVTVVAHRLHESLHDKVEWLKLYVPPRGFALQWLTGRHFIKKALGGRKFDIIHGHQPQIPDLCDVFQCHFLTRCAEERGCLESDGSLRGRAWRMQQRVVLKAEDRHYRNWNPATRMLFNSELTRQEFSRLYGMPPHQRVLPLAFPPCNFATDEQKRDAKIRWIGRVPEIPVIGYLGGIQQRKGYLRLIEAMRRDAGLYLLLGGQYADQFDPGELRDRIKCIGLVEDTASFFAACDAFVVPSLYEPLGFVAFEASSRGVPVIATSEVGALPHLEEFGAGLRWSPSESLAAAVKIAIEQAAKMRDGAVKMQQEMGEAAYQRALLEVYDSVLEKKVAQRCRMEFPDLIFVSLEDWDQTWRRNQFVCAEFARRHPSAKILFVGLARNVSNSLRRGKFSDLRGPVTHAVPGFDNIRVTHPLKLFPNSIPPARAINHLMFRHHVQKEAEKWQMRNPLLWLNPHWGVHMIGHMSESGVVYDITDDWTTFAQSPRLTRLTIDEDEDLCRAADAVIVCSRRLQVMKSAFSKSLYLIPNGVHADHYANVMNKSLPLPEAAAHWPQPVFGYTGTIHPERVDVKLVADLAYGLRRGSLVFVGPNHLPPSDMKLLNIPDKIIFAGPVPYEELPNYMRAFTVCMVPHRMTPFTESLNPIKLWEFLASGLPIVSTDVAGFRDYPAFVRIARTPNEFMAQLDEACREDHTLPERRRLEARRQSWASRMDDIERVITRIQESKK